MSLKSLLAFERKLKRIERATIEENPINVSVFAYSPSEWNVNTQSFEDEINAELGLVTAFKGFEKYKEIIEKASNLHEARYLARQNNINLTVKPLTDPFDEW